MEAVRVGREKRDSIHSSDARTKYIVTLSQAELFSRVTRLLEGFRVRHSLPYYLPAYLCTYLRMP